jgi:hypothetical protein
MFLRFVSSWGCSFGHNAGAGVPASNFVLGGTNGVNPFVGSAGSYAPLAFDPRRHYNIPAPGALLVSPPPPPQPGYIPHQPDAAPSNPLAGPGIPLPAPPPDWVTDAEAMLLVDPTLRGEDFATNPFSEEFEWGKSQPGAYSYPVRSFPEIMRREGFDVGR